MSRIPRPASESTQDPAGRFGSLKGSMRKGFQSLRETLKKKDAAGPTTNQPQITMMQDQIESGPRDDVPVSVPVPLELPPPPPPPRQPVRTVKWDEEVHEPRRISTKPGPAPLELPPPPPPLPPRQPVHDPAREEEVQKSGRLGIEPQHVTFAVAPPPLHMRTLKQEEKVHGPNGVSSEFQSKPLDPAPPRLPIRNPKRNGVVLSPRGDAGAEEVPVADPIPKFKVKKSKPIVRGSYVKQLPSPPPSEPRSSHSAEGEQQVEGVKGIDSTLDAVNQPKQEDCAAQQSTTTVPEVVKEEALPSSDANDASATYSMTAFTDCMQSIKERMDKIRAKMALGLEEDEIDPALEVRGSRMMEQIASLKEEVANVRESKYILSEEDISSIEIECPPRAPELFDAMMAAQKKVDDIVEEARELAARVEAEEEKRRVEEEERREEEEKKIKPPPDAPTAPKAMLERRAQRAAAAQSQQSQSQSWGRTGPRSSVQRQATRGGHPNQRRPYNSQSMPRGGYRNPTPNPPRRNNPQSKPQDQLESQSQSTSQSYSHSGPPPQPMMPYETWTMPRGGWSQNHGYNWPQGPLPINAMWHNPGAVPAGVVPYVPGPTHYFTGYSPYGTYAPMGGNAP